MPWGPGVGARLAFGAARRLWAGPSEPYGFVAPNFCSFFGRGIMLIPGRRFSHAIHTTNTSKGAARVGHGRLSTFRWRHVRAYADYHHSVGRPRLLIIDRLSVRVMLGVRNRLTSILLRQLGVRGIIDRFHQSSFQSSRVVIH